jgi:Tfp pilus assembly protein PilF
MAQKSIVGQIADEILGAPVPAGATPAEALQEQRDVLEAGVRLGLAALAQDSPETARAHLEEALQRCGDIAARPLASSVAPPPID